MNNNIHDQFSNEFPSKSNAISIFSNEWASLLPRYGAGVIPLFEDQRLHNIINMAGGLLDKKCLELGPLEGGHTYMMHNAGAPQITSIEANQRAFLKCLITKYLYDYNANLILGDLSKYIEKCNVQYDFTCMLGILYHMENPFETIKNVTRISRQIGCWTHYYDYDIISKNKNIDWKFDGTFTMEIIQGKKIHAFKHSYLDDLSSNTFFGGNQKISRWMPKQDILDLLSVLGFKTTIIHDDVSHPHGPCITFLAEKQD